MPQLSIDPSDSGDEAVGFDGAKNCACFGVHLIDLSVPVMSDPESPFGPGEPRVAAGPRRRDGGEDPASLWVDLLNAILRDLKKVPAVKCGSCMRGDVDRTLHLPT